MNGVGGKILGLKINGAFVSCEISCSINFEVDMLPASAVDSGRWKEFIAGIRSWTVSCDANLILELVPSDIKGAINTGFLGGLPIFLQFSTRPSVEIQLILSGEGILSSGSITAPSNGKATTNMTFQGTGELTSTFQDFNLLIDAMPSFEQWPIVVDEDQ